MAAAVEIKSIKPQRFDDKAFAAVIAAAAQEAAADMQKDFEKTTETWEHEVKFETIISMDPDVEVLVGTDDEIYGYINEGTKPHAIFPKRARALRFQWGGKGSYRAKTKPKVIGSQPGGATGPVVHRPYVQHPGTKPRKFDETIEKKWRSPFKRRMEKAMADAGKASGHG